MLTVLYGFVTFVENVRPNDWERDALAIIFTRWCITNSLLNIKKYLLDHFPRELHHSLDGSDDCARKS